ncbi:MAG: hypothetical protein ABUL44_02480, partial [Flavobacterium sp.]
MKVKQYNLYLIVPGVVLALIGFVAVAFITKKQENTFLAEYNKWKQRLISTGLHIEVDLSKVEVKSNAYREEIETELPRHHLMAFELLTDRDNRVFDNVVQSV